MYIFLYWLNINDVFLNYQQLCLLSEYVYVCVNIFSFFLALYIENALCYVTYFQSPVRISFVIYNFPSKQGLVDLYRSREFPVPIYLMKYARLTAVVV